jgi:antigen flippase
MRLASFWNTNRDYVGNILTDGTVVIAGFLSSIMIARGLGPEGRGQLSAALLWPGTFSILSMLGLSHAFAYAISARWASPGRLARFGVAYSLGVGLPLAFAYFLLAPKLFRVQFSPVPFSIRLFGLFIPFSLWLGLWWELYRGVGDFLTWNVVKLLRSIGYTTWIAVAFLIGAASVPSILWSQIPIILVSLLFLGCRLRRFPSNTETDPIQTGKIMKYGLAVYASSIFYMLNQQIDQLFLSLSVTPASLGQYATAVNLSGIILVGSSAIGAVAFSRLARIQVNASERRVQTKWALLVGGSILLPAGVTLTIFAPVVVRVLYGPLFAPAGELLRVLAPAAVLLGGGNIFSDLLRGAGRPLLATYSMVVGVVVTIPALIWLLPSYGIWAAAWVSLVVYGLMLLFQAVSLFILSKSWSSR